MSMLAKVMTGFHRSQKFRGIYHGEAGKTVLPRRHSRAQRLNPPSKELSYTGADMGCPSILACMRSLSAQSRALTLSPSRASPLVPRALLSAMAHPQNFLTEPQQKSSHLKWKVGQKTARKVLNRNVCRRRT